MTEQNTIDELAIRLARAHYHRTRGEQAPFQTLAELAPGIAGVWRTMALTVQDVLGIEGVNSTMSVMDNLARARGHRAARIRANDKRIMTAMDHVREAFGRQ